MKHHTGRDLQYKSLSEIGAYIYQMYLPVERKEDPGSVMTVNKRRKTSTELGPRQIKNSGKEIINYVSKNMCVNDEDATPYIVAALKESRTADSLNTISRSLFGNTY